MGDQWDFAPGFLASEALPQYWGGYASIGEGTPRVKATGRAIEPSPVAGNRPAPHLSSVHRSRLDPPPNPSCSPRAPRPTARQAPPPRPAHWPTGSRCTSSACRRLAAQPAALATIQSQFTTTGGLRLPVVTDHTLLDPIVRARQELVYAAKVAVAGESGKLSQFRGPAVRPLRLHGGGAAARVWAPGSGDGRASSRDLEHGSRTAGASIRGLRAAGEADARVTAPATAHC
jgi:hypothetical protein